VVLKLGVTLWRILEGENDCTPVIRRLKAKLAKNPLRKENITAIISAILQC